MSSNTTLPEGVVATAVSAGYGHTCAVLSTGGVQCWGDDYYGQSTNTP